MAVGCDLETDVGVVGADRILNLRQRLVIDADEGALVKETVVDSCNRGVRLRFTEVNVDGGKNSARNGQQMRREDDLVLIDADLLEHFTGVAMSEDAVGGEIVGKHT